MHVLKSKAAWLLAALLFSALAAAQPRFAMAQDLGEWTDGYEWSEPEFWIENSPSRVWGSLEYLLWWRTGMNTPPLVTTGNPANPNAGILDPAVAPETQILFGGDRLEDQVRSGGRINLGTWFDMYETIGVGGTFYGLGRQTNVFQLDSTVSPLIAVPFFDVNTGLENALLLSAPGITGGIAITTNSDVVGGDLYLRGNFIRDRGLRFDWLLGYQSASIQEDLLIAYNLNNGVNNFNINDQFSTQNFFNAGTLGISGEGRRGRFTWSFLTKLGLGNMREKVFITGQNTITPGPITTNGGFFAQGTNSGAFTRDQFTVSPELGLKAGWDINPMARMTVGYSFIYFSNVAQPGDQINRNINDTQLNGGALVGAAQPSFIFQDSGYVLHGLTVGLDVKF